MKYRYEYREMTKEDKERIKAKAIISDTSPYPTFEEYSNKWKDLSNTELTIEVYERSKKQHEDRIGKPQFFMLAENGTAGFTITRCFEDIDTLDQKYLVNTTASESLIYFKEKDA